MATTAPAPLLRPVRLRDRRRPAIRSGNGCATRPRSTYNEKYEFYAISRYEDVERCFVDWQTYSSAKGSVLEIIKAEMEMPGLSAG